VIAFVSRISTNAVKMAMANSSLVRVGPRVKEVATVVTARASAIRPSTASLDLAVTHRWLRGWRSTAIVFFEATLVGIRRNWLTQRATFSPQCQPIHQFIVARGSSSRGNIIFKGHGEMLVVAGFRKVAFSFQLPRAKALLCGIGKSVKKITSFCTAMANSSHPMAASTYLPSSRNRFLSAERRRKLKRRCDCERHPGG